MKSLEHVAAINEHEHRRTEWHGVGLLAPPRLGQTGRLEEIRFVEFLEIQPFGGQRANDPPFGERTHFFARIDDGVSTQLFCGGDLGNRRVADVQVCARAGFPLPLHSSNRFGQGRIVNDDKSDGRRMGRGRIAPRVGQLLATRYHDNGQ